MNEADLEAIISSKRFLCRTVHGSSLPATKDPYNESSLYQSFLAEVCVCILSTNSTRNVQGTFFFLTDFTLFIKSTKRPKFGNQPFVMSKKADSSSSLVTKPPDRCYLLPPSSSSCVKGPIKHLALAGSWKPSVGSPQRAKYCFIFS